MIIDIKKLWKDGGYGKDNPLDRTIAYVYDIAKKNNVPREAADAIISETFIGLANGDKYSTVKCTCGCESEKSGTDIAHCMAKRVLEKGEEIRIEMSKVLENTLNTMILNRISEQNKEYIAKEMKPPHPFFDYSRSPVNKLRKRIFKSGS